MLAELQGGFLNGDGGLGAAQVDGAVQWRVAVGRVAVGVAVVQLGVVLAYGAGLVGDDVAGHQADADHEGVVAGVVVTAGAGGAEGEAGVDAIATQGAAGRGEGADGDGAGEVGGEQAPGGGDQLVALVAVEAGVQAQAGWDQVVDAQVLGAAFGQGDEDVVEHSLAHHQVCAGGVAGAGVAVVQAAAGEALADGGRGYLLAGDVGERHGHEVLPAFGAGVVGELGAGLQGRAGIDAGRDQYVVGDHHQVGTAVVGGGAWAAGEQGADTGAIDEADAVGGIVHRIVGAGHQAGAVAAVDQQVRAGQVAADEGQARRQGDAGADVIGAAATAVLDGGGQAQAVAAVDAGDVAIDRGDISDAAAEGHASGTRRIPAAGGAGHRAVAGGDDAVADVEHRLGHRGNQGDVGTSE